ncbi:MAG TPA: winged helix-turn-helix domain-containing protein [Thermoleophilaceae bacterium]
MESAIQGEVLHAGALEVRPAEYSAVVAGRQLSLTVRELQLLTALTRRAERIVSREELYEEVWGRQLDKCDRSVDVYVSKLRQKLELALPGSNYIHTHFGFGYRLSAGGSSPYSGSSHLFHTDATSR